jgi:hypothetical protein
MYPETLYENMRKGVDAGSSFDLSFWVLIGLMVLLTVFLIFYLGSKREDSAEKEDAINLAKQIADMRGLSERQLQILEQLHRIAPGQAGRHYGFRQAAMDKRLNAHQEAYILWWGMMENLRSKERIAEVVNRCQKWWVQNCLYLTPEAREAFRKAYHAAILHPELVSNHGDKKEIQDTYNTVREAGRVLVKAVSPPSSSEEEYRPIRRW